MTMMFQRLALGLVLAATCLPSSAAAASESERAAYIGSSSAPDAVKVRTDDRVSERESQLSACGYLTRAACFPVSWVVGTPVAMVRDARKEWLRETHVWTKESKNPMVSVPAGLFWTPFASFAGFIRGPVIALNYAWISRPFSKESFSLGDNLPWYGPDAEGNEAEP